MSETQRLTSLIKFRKHEDWHLLSNVAIKKPAWAGAQPNEWMISWELTENIYDTNISLPCPDVTPVHGVEFEYFFLSTQANAVLDMHV